MNEGKKDRRDPIRTIKARNPVAKNATAAIGGGAAGAHKDKKKAMKQGDTKHKNQEYAEHLSQALKNKLAEGDDPNLAKAYRMGNAAFRANNKDALKTIPKQYREMWIKGWHDGERFASEKSVSEQAQYNKFRVGQRATFKNSQGQEFPVIVTAVDYDDEAVKIKSAENKPFPNGELELEVDPGWKFLTPDRQYNPNSLVKATSRESRVGEEFDSPEYNDEAGMARSNLLTLARAVKGLFDTIEKNDNLPEWAQEKIAKAEMMLVSVWDYMLSQKAQGIDPEVNELNKNTLGSYVKKASGDLADRASSSSFKSGAAGDKYNKADPSRRENNREKGIGRAVDKLAKEGWTHDTLAARLFETENTYEEQLQNKLNRRLGK